MSYWLQYLGRVLVSSAMGECAPPRTPDRNFDGFFNGLSPWFIWLVLGLGLGPGARRFGWRSRTAESRAAGAWLLLALAAAGLPYILAALMLSFLHDDAMAAMPWGVLLGLVRLGPAFLMLCGLIAAALGFAGGCFALALGCVGRLSGLTCWSPWSCCMILLWIQMVVMRLLGVFYFHHKDVAPLAEGGICAGGSGGDCERRLHPGGRSDSRLQRRPPFLVELLQWLARQLLEGVLLVATFPHERR